MNFLILVNAAKNYKYYHYNIAEELRLRGHDVFFAVDSVRSSILEPLPEIDNSEKTYFFDNYLKSNFNTQIEFDKEVLKENKKEYWGDIFYSDFDRFLTHKYNLNKSKTYWHNVKLCLEGFFKKIIEEHKIDFIIYENVSNSFAYAAYKTGKDSGCGYLGLMGSRLPNHFEIQSSIIEDQLDEIDNLTTMPPSRSEIQWFEDYKSNILNIQPDYMSSNGLDDIGFSKFANYKKLSKLFHWMLAENKYDHYYDYMFGSPLKASMRVITYNISRKVNSQISNNYFLSSQKVDKLRSKEQFYVYPIHFHPESSTSVLAPEYTNEINNIINISNNLPFGVLLYVKDHKSALGVKGKDFYRQIKALPNVRLIHPSYNIKQLIVDSLGVITVNSTAGFEALILNKPVFLLGRVFYERFPNTIKLNNFREIRNIVDYNSNSNEKELMNYVIAYKRFCNPGNLNMSSLEPRDKDYYKRTVDIILEKTHRKSPAETEFNI